MSSKLTYRDAVLQQYLSSTYSESHTDSNVLLGGSDLTRQLVFFRNNYLKHLPTDKNSNILELGPGLGQFLHFLRTEGFQNISGIDGSPEVAANAQKSGFSVGVSNNFITTLSLPEHQNRYDTIIGNDILEHFTKQEFFELLMAINGALKKNGYLIAKVPNAACILGSTSRYWDFTHELGLTENSIRQILPAAQFKNIQTIEPNLYCFYKNPLNYVGKFFYLLQKYIQLALHKLNGNFGVKIVSNNIMFVAQKCD